MTAAAPLVVGALQVSAPVVRLAGQRRWVDAELVGVFAHSVNIRCHGGPRLLVNLADADVESVCQARVRPADLYRMRNSPIGRPVLLQVATDDVVPTRLVPSGRPEPFEVLGSWFDSAVGGLYGRPRLERAARAMASGRDLDAPGELCGLGVGLTPSGDDALVGLIAASSCAGVGAGARARLAARMRAGWADRRTTETSLTALRLALDGDFSDPLLELLAALTGRGDVSDATWRVLPHGHTSGADLMAGVDALARALIRPPVEDHEESRIS